MINRKEVKPGQRYFGGPSGYDLIFKKNFDLKRGGIVEVLSATNSNVLVKQLLGKGYTYVGEQVNLAFHENEWVLLNNQGK